MYAGPFYYNYREKGTSYEKILLSVVTALSVFTLAAWRKEENKLVVGASNVPHAVILEKAQPILEKKGIKLEIKKFQDYVLPNKALADKEIDANYFQHIPYLDKEIQEKGYKIVNRKNPFRADGYLF